MGIPKLKLSRPWPRIAGTTAILMIAGLMFRCGTDDKKKNDSNPPTISPEIPADWNGASDWNGSPWKVTDE